MVWGILKLPRPLKRLSRALLAWLPLMAYVLHVVLSMSRGYALYKGNLGNSSCQSTCNTSPDLSLPGYHAPLDLYKVLHMDEAELAVERVKEVNLCVGKEWHRFPSSFFLPEKK